MLRRRLGRPINTDKHEDVIASDAINPDHIDVTLADVGGLEETKAALVRSACCQPTHNLEPEYCPHQRR